MVDEKLQMYTLSKVSTVRQCSLDTLFALILYYFYCLKNKTVGHMFLL